MSLLLILVIAITLLGAGLIAISSDIKFWNIVRNKDPALWEKLGRPVGLRYWPGQSISGRERAEFRRTRKFLELGDPQLETYHRRSAIASMIFLVVGLGFCLFGMLLRL